MVCVQVDMLPQASVAVQIRVNEPQVGNVGGSLNVTVAVPQLSVAVAKPVAFGLVSPPHDTNALAGQMITGAVVSLTVMTCVQEAVLPQASVAVHVRVIVLLQLEPGLLWVWLKVTGIVPPQLSVAVTAAGGGTSLRHWKLAGDGQPLST